MARRHLALITLAVVLAGTPAHAHTQEEQDTWYQDWSERAVHGITPDLLDELRWFRDRHRPRSVSVTKPGLTQTPGTHSGMGTSVTQWEGLVAQYFPATAVPTMMCLMVHESGGNPNAVNPRSGAAGLFQVMPFWWDHYGGDRFDPARNVQVARWIWDQQGYAAWSPWNRGLCR